MKFNRRHFLKAAGAGLALANIPGAIHAATPPRIIVIGGGFAGATAAKYLRLWSNFTVDVTLVDPKPFHTSCILSNMVLNNAIAYSELEIPFTHLQANYGVTVVQDSAEEIDGAGNRVRLNAAGWQSYDRLVLAPGIGFKNIYGLDSAVNPHAWIAGPQTTLLASQVASMQMDSTFVMSIPKAPYRCPPGPYERACLVADQLVRNGYTTGNTPRVVVLDANPSIQAEANTFTRAFNDLYGNIIQYVPNAEVQGVDAGGGNVYTTAGQFHGDVLNIIPENQATQFVQDSGLTDGGRWAPIDPTTYESTVSGYTGIHIIGDSQGSKAPKSGHMANAQAKVCADAILRILSGLPTDSDERLANLTTNSACYSPITRDQASWLTANYAYDKNFDEMQLVHIGEAEEWSKDNFKEMFVWASNMFTDSFA